MTAGRGIDREQAEALVDCGLKAVRVLVGGVSDRVQQSVMGLPAIEAHGCGGGVAGGPRQSTGGDGHRGGHPLAGSQP